MSKNKFVIEYELKASAKMLFPYLSTASGLQQWFAAKVNYKPDQSFDFYWDGENHPAKLHSSRLNKSIRFDFLTSDIEKDQSYLEFKLDVGELSQSTFLKITDYTDNQDNDELESVWEGLINGLREIVGG
jgi:uncharacterized protein YndB with AHSA1/START domain